MRRFSPEIPLPLPSVKQVLWRAQCPAHQAGDEMETAAERAVLSLRKLRTVWCGGILFFPEETPGDLAHLFPGKPVSVMAATLGSGMDGLLNSESALEGFLANSAGSVAVELLMKRLQSHIATELDLIPTRRVAPGYGDIPLSLQKGIVSMFPASGIECTEEHMLVPVKSMTGVTGWIQPAN